ncbi:hypothetical protein DFH08DRAFT_1024721 [Mycena albidolilacea]|uniref:Uncharacterized protein n=1 Tax=Mycena albidolilacea TaxID=1033008 RepID=A0AAD7AMB8_9AGAR|nr:hypothetical protein DFH08DRAFT_1024721 [Mycena albidolilacea]
MWPLHSFCPQSRTILFLLLLPASFVEGAIINTTIDDTETSFNWSESWTAVTPSEPCAGCASKPDASQVEGGSWHDGNIMTTKDDSAGGSFTFQGSAVYIYGIDQAGSEADIVFTLDSITSTHHYTGSDRFAYHALFFSATGLAADRTHTVNWALAKNSASDRDLQTTLFDYAVVTSGTAVTTTTESGSSNGGLGSSTTTAGNSCGLLYIRLGRNLTTQQNCHVLRIIFLDLNQKEFKSIFGLTTALCVSSPVQTGIHLGNYSTAAPAGSSDKDGADPSPSGAAAHSKSNVGAIIGVVLGTFLVVVLATVCFYVVRRRGQRRRTAVTPYEAPPRISRWRGRGIHSIHPFVAEPPPRNITTAAATSGPRSEKTLESPAPKRAGKATASLVRNATQRSRTFDVAQSPVSVSSSASASITARERMLEERLAELEARIGNAPPPYVTE